MRASTMTFHEYYGELPTYLLRKVKKNNVSPADYWQLQDAYGEDNYNTIHDMIVRYSDDGMFKSWTWARAEGI